jgi:hypothetical protein
MKSYAEFESEDRRLVLLRALQHAAQYRTNAFLLRRYCASVGHTVSADRLEQDLAWLKEQGLIELEQVDKVSVATLTPRGLDVATGAATLPGVQRLQPGY